MHQLRVPRSESVCSALWRASIAASSMRLIVLWIIDTDAEDSRPAAR